MQMGYGQTQKIEVRYDNSSSSGQDCALHPLIHTFPLRRILLHVVAGQKGQECGFKYVILISTRKIGELYINDGTALL